MIFYFSKAYIWFLKATNKVLGTWNLCICFESQSVRISKMCAQSIALKLQIILKVLKVKIEYKQLIDLRSDLVFLTLPSAILYINMQPSTQEREEKHMRETERGGSIICVCQYVYSGNSESGTFSLGLFSSVYGEWWGTTLPERKASFPSPNPIPSCSDEERSVSNLCFPPSVE